jgi:hypothetical protein
MLEAQFRHAGQRLSDLDLDALDSLKAMDEVCRQAAVKVLLPLAPPLCHHTLVYSQHTLRAEFTQTFSFVVLCFISVSAPFPASVVGSTTMVFSQRFAMPRAVTALE